MKPFRPNSIISLIFAGFALAVLPLMVALIYAVVAVDQLAEQGQRMVNHAVKATQGSRTLMEQITLMERGIRQYQVLGDEALFQSYEESRKQFVTTLGWLGELPLPAPLRKLVGQLVVEESSFYDYVHGAPDRVSSEAVQDVFSSLAEKTQRVLEQSQQLIDAEVARTQSSAEKVQHTLLLLASALVPLVLLLVAFFAVLITRPLQRLDESVRRLGDGDFSQPVTLSGSRDLQQLGERLDWMRSRLLEVEEEKLRFLRHLSHELKTPLTTLREGAELLREEIPGALNESQREIVELLRSNGVQLQKLIEDLLKFNTITQRGGSVLNLELVRFDEVIKTLLAEYKVVVMSRQLHFVTALAEVTVQGDKEKLRVVVDNLLSNAIKFSPQQGQIQIRLMEMHDFAVIDIRDQGPGVAPEQRTRIFEAFYQGSAPYTGHVKGSGLGLAIAREYVVAHGGTIKVVDGDKGAHLRILLPLQQQQELKNE